MRGNMPLPDRRNGRRRTPRRRRTRTRRRRRSRPCARRRSHRRGPSDPSCTRREERRRTPMRSRNARRHRTPECREPGRRPERARAWGRAHRLMLATRTVTVRRDASALARGEAPPSSRSVTARALRAFESSRDSDVRSDARAGAAGRPRLGQSARSARRTKREPSRFGCVLAVAIGSYEGVVRSRFELRGVRRRPESRAGPRPSIPTAVRRPRADAIAAHVRGANVATFH